jgi:hypothetical protein
MGLARMRRCYRRRSAAKTAALAPVARNSRDISDIFMHSSKLATRLSKYQSNNDTTISDSK